MDHSPAALRIVLNRRAARRRFRGALLGAVLIGGAAYGFYASIPMFCF